jgi:hypothetical protein
MTVLETKEAMDQPDNAASILETEIGYFVQGEVVAQQPTPHAVSELDVDGLTSLITRVSSHSAGQIDGIIAELNEVRNYLRSEGKRIQREIRQFAQMNQNAIASTKIISEALGPGKGADLDKLLSADGVTLALPLPHNKSE